MKYLYFLAIFSTWVLTGCDNRHSDTVFQVSTLDALAAGVYEGSLTCRKLVRHGDFGIGTFDDLERVIDIVKSTGNEIVFSVECGNVPDAIKSFEHLSRLIG